MSREEFGEWEYLKNLSEKEKMEYDRLPADKKRRILTQALLSKQDDAMWDKNEGISQLEGRIETNSFQG